MLYLKEEVGCSQLSIRIPVLVMNLALFVFTLALEIVITVLCIVGSQKQDVADEPGYKDSLFQWHTGLMAPAVVIVFSNGMIARRALFFLPRLVSRIIHAVLMVAWFLMAVAGFAIIIRCKVEVDDDHFAEGHERIGLILVAITLLQILVGLFKSFFITLLGVRLVTWHGKLGSFLYVIALTTVCTGVQLLFEVEEPDPAYYYPDDPTADPTVTIPPILNLRDYAIVIYVLTGVLGIIVLFYEHLLHLIPIPPREKEKNPEESSA